MDKTRDILVVVEPGTPAGYARVVALREQLVAAGAHVLAPCPHDRHCPLVSPDWCHFPQRLARSRAHKQVKGADVPFEDERFSYIVLSRTPSAAPASRVLAQPAIGKAEITAKLCTIDGLDVAKVPRHDGKPMRRPGTGARGDAVAGKTTGFRHLPLNFELFLRPTERPPPRGLLIRLFILVQIFASPVPARSFSQCRPAPIVLGVIVVLCVLFAFGAYNRSSRFTSASTRSIRRHRRATGSSPRFDPRTWSDGRRAVRRMNTARWKR